MADSLRKHTENLKETYDVEQALDEADRLAEDSAYGRSATSIENKCKIEYGTEQGLAALIYGEKGLSSLPIQDITGEHIDTDNEYMYYYSVEFIK